MGRYMGPNELPMVNENEDYYLRPDSGRLKRLKVQKAPNWTKQNQNRTWEDAGIATENQGKWSWFQSITGSLLVWLYDEWWKNSSERNGMQHSMYTNYTALTFNRKSKKL
jgi:hypothetical protein